MTGKSVRESARRAVRLCPSREGLNVNKAQLIEALADRLGDRKTAGLAVDSVVDVIVRAVHSGDKVTITGFGVFEKRERAARVARNPRTGESVKVKKTNVPAFRAGTLFKEVIGGQRKLPKASAKPTTRAAAGTAARVPAQRTASATKTTTTRATAAKPAARTTTRATATKTATRTTTAKATVAKPAVKKTVAAKPAAKATATKATATKATAVKKATAAKPAAKATATKATAVKKAAPAKKAAAKKK
ncbi:HU family DNA-binding protein [Pseudonocardiaceae bacterium YIM PH 21723]|nr:HU family DNA-binding protein [Pseudonocardiaceae bacterium YIM PH 21723]